MGNQANVHTYAGTSLTKQVGHQPLFNTETWFDPQGITNILFLAIVTKHYPVAFDTTGNFFTVQLQDREIVFRQSNSGLCYFDAKAEKEFVGSILTSVVDRTPNKTCLMSTVDEKRLWFTPCKFSRAKLARHIYAMIGIPSGRYFHNMVPSHAIK